MDHRRSALLVVLATALVALLARPASAAVGPDPERGRQWGLLDIKAPDAWPKGRGGGVSVAVVSTGIAEHPDLKVKLDGGFDATGGAPTDDTDGRGTHLAGIVAAATDNALGIAGVAPSARLLPYKAFDSGSANDTYLKALDRALATKPGVVLVDLPSDYRGDVDQLRAKLRALGDAGASVVIGAQDVIAASALNDLPVLAVAATARNGSGSGAVGARGVAAPGVGILSTTVKQPALPTGTPTYDYGELDGTGQAAAHVAGALAILRGLGANAADAADLLRSTARKSGNAAFGAGIIDVAAATAAKVGPPPAPVTTSTTTKAAVKPGATKRTGPGGTTIPPAQVSPVGPATGLLPNEPAEPGAGEEAVTPPGIDQFAGGEATGGGPSTPFGGEERPWGALTIGFGLLFGVSSVLSVTFRRMAGPAV